MKISHKLFLKGDKNKILLHHQDLPGKTSGQSHPGTACSQNTWVEVSEMAEINVKWWMSGNQAGQMPGKATEK